MVSLLHDGQVIIQMRTGNTYGWGAQTVVYGTYMYPYLVCTMMFMLKTH